MGIKVVLPGVVFTDTSLPVLSADSLISAGTLFLADFGREETLGLTTTPANGTAVGNLAWEQAAAIIGSGDAASLSGTWESTLAGHPDKGLVERTTKKGVHIIASQTAMDGAARHAGFILPAAVKAYIHANIPSHVFYISSWGRLTRLATQVTDAIFHVADVAAPTTSYAFRFNRQPWYSPTSGSAFVGAHIDPDAHSLGNAFRNLAVDEWTGTKPSEANTVARFWHGQHGQYTSFQNNAASSGIIYRFFVEDLTVSGRSYATVDAADKALYDIAFGSGGRFNGDTFTAVSTIP